MEQVYIWAQVVGFLAFILGIWGFLQTEDGRLKFIISGQNFVLALHYMLLGAYTGAGLALIEAALYFLSRLKIAPYWAWLFVIFYVVVGFLTVTTWYDGLVVVAAIAATLGLFYLTGLNLRLVLLGATTSWLIYNMAVGSIGPALMECFMLAANLKTLWALLLKKRAGV